jgi:hypothetical protein
LRHSFRVLIFDPAKTQASYEALELHEDPEFAGGSYTVKSTSPHDAELFRQAPIAALSAARANPGEADPDFILTKRFSWGPAPHGCELSCEVTLKHVNSAAAHDPTPGASLAIGIESVINFLAPDSQDRFFQSPNQPPHSQASHTPQPAAHQSQTTASPSRQESLRFSGELPAPILHLEDGWQKIRVTLTAPHAQCFYIAPIETVSESEEGFERVYQGSQILPVWRLSNFSEHKSFTARLTWRIEHL